MKAAAKSTTKAKSVAATRARARKTAAPVVLPRIVSLRPNGQVTIPAEIRAQAHARPGDLFLAEVTGDAIVLRRKTLIDADLAYFWTEAWQRGERAASADIKKGRFKTFRSMEALIADLHR